MNAPLTVKLGGAVAGGALDALRVLAQKADPSLVIVHGGGSEVGDWSRRLGIEPRFHDGLRVTDEQTVDVVVAVLGGLVNARLVAQLQAAGRLSIGLTGADGGLLDVEPMGAKLGAVATVTGVATPLLDELVDAGLTPVIASIAADDEGKLYNVNADEVAGAVAAARGGLLLLCTDVSGVIRDGAVLRSLGADEADAMLADGSASAGMRPKLRAAVTAARAGCEVRILDGRSADGLEAALAGQPAGTVVHAAARATA
jgi:acetylglutamate kinase